MDSFRHIEHVDGPIIPISPVNNLEGRLTLPGHRGVNVIAELIWLDESSQQDRPVQHSDREREHFSPLQGLPAYREVSISGQHDVKERPIPSASGPECWSDADKLLDSALQSMLGGK